MKAPDGTIESLFMRLNCYGDPINKGFVEIEFVRGGLQQPINADGTFSRVPPSPNCQVIFEDLTNLENARVHWGMEPSSIELGNHTIEEFQQVAISHAAKFLSSNVDVSQYRTTPEE